MAPKRIRGTIYLRFGQQTKLVLAGNMREYKDVVLVRVVQRHFPETCGKELDIKVDLAVPGVVITPDAWRAFADSDEAKEADMYTVELATAPQKPSPPHLPSKKIRIRLLSGCGEEVEFLCSPTTTVRKLQTGFETRMGVEAGENRLVYDGRNLWADKTVGYYGMQDGDTIDVIPELKGGKPVIYLRSPVELDATVEVGLVPEWSFSALYPVVTATNPKNPRLHQSALWSVKTATDGTMLDKQSGAHVSYLFWEALTNPITNELSPPPSPVLGTSDVFRPALARNTFKHAASVALTIEEGPALPGRVSR
ncbi:hypothetical protein C8F01DRAFT_347137 [Mycena amicta]|nr:hypothetical protein C8F01DRAFT_347137 [Mycena amicta]